MIEFEKLGEATQHPLFPGTVGALIGLRWAPGASWFERFTNVFSGSACAAFVAPAGAEWLHVTSHGMQGCFAFFLGMFGMSLASAVMTGLRDVNLAEIFTSWISKKG